MKGSKVLWLTILITIIFINIQSIIDFIVFTSNILYEVFDPYFLFMILCIYTLFTWISVGAAGGHEFTNISPYYFLSPIYTIWWLIREINKLANKYLGV